jgi:hypothetical protein
MRRFPGLTLILLGLLSLGAFAAAVAPLSADEKPATPPGAVEVRLSEYKIDIPSTLPAGPTTFALHNEGNKKHAFKLEGPGIDGTQSAILEAHQTGELKVTLQPGEYKVYCPIGSHSNKGMSLKLTVTAIPGG